MDQFIARGILTVHFYVDLLRLQTLRPGEEGYDMPDGNGTHNTYNSRPRTHSFQGTCPIERPVIVSDDEQSQSADSYNGEGLQSPIDGNKKSGGSRSILNDRRRGDNLSLIADEDLVMDESDSDDNLLSPSAYAEDMGINSMECESDHILIFPNAKQQQNAEGEDDISDLFYRIESPVSYKAVNC